MYSFLFPMISLKIVSEFCSINRKFSSITLDLLPENILLRCTTFSASGEIWIFMADLLHKAIGAIGSALVAESTRNHQASKPPNMRAEPLESPPGFPLLFLELSNQDRKMAMLYISHSDDTERLARIERVKQGIAETLENPSVRLPKITQNLDKGKGHVFDFSEPSGKRLQLSGRDHVELPLNMERLDNETESASSSAPIHTFSAPALVTTGFHLGPSSEGRVHGNQSTSDEVGRVMETIRVILWTALVVAVERSWSGEKELI
ncbi:hypothetical protein HID58_023540 [Brassica napus]|uniref:Uncharacterized protein n=1 Tax=Brassica napus TaxID=3708 RepID=A0ABQ8D2C8_BRANA|nr:hypothetical protein HID58_023540 [Brassica napus]